ncbi:MAG: hypothetical protein Q8M98_08800 [Candidatus Cloacimonadaceae bacterium]|nr:hypothetical protein [Candidatus Cloacimonadaceae bacterium]
MKFVKHLAAMDYNIIVLSVQAKYLRHPKDPELLLELPNSVEVHRAFCPDMNWLFKLLWGLRLNWLVKLIRQRLLIPDTEKLWLPFARKKLHAILTAHRDIAISVVSSGPPSVLFLGLELKNRYSVHFICDFRDEWTNNPERINLDYPASTQSRELILEAGILMASAGIVYLTQIMKDNFERSYPFIREKPSEIIPNGFDEDDFKGLTVKPSSDTFVLLYSGSFYDRRQPDPLWKAISELAQSGAINPKHFRVEIIGKNTPTFVLGAFAKDALINEIVNIEGFKPHRVSLQAMYNADALLLFIPSGKNTDSVLTGKIFDYLRSGKAILAIVPPKGLAAEIVLKAGSGFVAEHSDFDGIKRCLKEVYELWQAGRLSDLKTDKDYINGFSRQQQAMRLAALIDKALI